MSRPRARSRNSARAVRKMIGIFFVRSSSSRSSATRQPSSAGIITSSRITSGCSLRALSSPLWPSSASSTVIRSASRLTRQSSLIGASSSITSTRVTAPSPGAERRASYPRPFLLNLRRSEWQLEREARPLPLLGLHRDPTAHRGDEPLRDEQPEAGSRGGVAAALELEKDAFLLRLRDADALVRHDHLDAVRAVATSGDRHRSPFR